MVRVGRTCSWCHELNWIDAPPVYCACGHRADVCRMDCDCPACVRPDTSPPWLLPPVGDLHAVLDSLGRRRAARQQKEPENGEEAGGER